MHLKSSPAYSMGSGKRTDLVTSAVGVPGPATYSVTAASHASSPRAVFPRSAKQSLPTHSEGPGPGNYPFKSRLGDAPKAVLTPRRTLLDPNSDGPGPNDYSPKPVESVKAYSFRGKSEQMRNKVLVPGPGAYTPIEKESVPTILFGTGERVANLDKEDKPGPGAYDVANSADSHTPRFTFPRADREGRSRTLDPRPGPGAYTVSRTFENLAAAPTLVSRRASNQHQLDQIPGPGAYSPVRKLPTVAYSIGRSPKTQSNTAHDGPSPAAYSPKVPRKSPPGWAMGTSRRKSLGVRSDSPGPGAYQPNPTETSLKFSMRMKLQDSHPTILRNDVPGPGHYSPNSLLETSPSVVIGTSPKYSPTPLEGLPAPGKYEIKRELNGSKFSFGRSGRNVVRKEEVPGPGKYDIASSVANVPKYVINGS